MVINAFGHAVAGLKKRPAVYLINISISFKLIFFFFTRGQVSTYETEESLVDRHADRY